MVNDTTIPQITTAEESTQGWVLTDAGVLIIKAGVMEVQAGMHILIR